MTDYYVIQNGRSLSVAEKFGPTLQGEGPSLGKPAMFLRLGLCNLDCSWCDTPFTWDWTGKNGVKYDKAEQLSRVTLQEIVDWFVASGTNRLVITGGEPLVQKAGLVNLVHLLLEVNPDYRIEIETNGTIEPPLAIFELVQWNISPKLASSGVHVAKRYIPNALERFTECPQHSFKFVICDPVRDLLEIKEMVRMHGLSMKDIYLMPEGRSAEEINQRLPELFDIATTEGTNVTTRLHVLAFGDRRGV